MFYLQRHILLPTIGACPVPLFQQIFATFVSCQRSLLVFHPRNFGVLHGFQVELDELHTDCRDRAEFRKPLYPCEDIRDPALKRRWEPTLLLFFSILPTGLTVSRFSSSTRTTDGATVIKFGLDSLSLMGYFCRKDDLPARIVHESYARRFRAWIELDTKLCNERLLNSHFQDQRERIAL